VSPAAAKAEIDGIIATDARLRATVVPINQRFLGRPTDPGWLAFITAGFLVFLVSCANVANLLLARAVVRAREFAIRGSLGARRLRIAGQLLIESLVLAALGAAVGVAVSLAGVRVFASFVPENTLPYWLNYGMDGRVLAALVGVSFIAVLVFGLVPALQGSRVDVNRILKEGGRSATGRRGARRLTTAFLVAEFALTIVLVANVVTSLRNNTPPLPSDARINSRELVVASVTLPSDKYPSAQQRAAFYAELDARLAADTSISAAAIASVPPGPGGTEQRLEVEGHTLGAGDKPPTVWSVAATPGYFEALTVPVVRGRALAADDGRPGRTHAVVSERFVELFMPGKEPIGYRIRLTSPASAAPAEWLTIVGVSQTIRQRSGSSDDPIVYVPLAMSAPSNATVLVRSSAETSSLTAALRGRLMEVDANVPLYRIRTMKRALEDADWNGRLSIKLITALTLVTLAFTVVGLYAVTAHAVTQRTQEIGIRMALGARPAEVSWLILRRAAFQVALGLAAGIAATAAWDGVFFSGRVELRFVQADTFVSLAVVLTVITVIACIVPVRRATRLDPVAALRQD
jgi:putative ABC transport system permease protein